MPFLTVRNGVRFTTAPKSLWACNHHGRSSATCAMMGGEWNEGHVRTNCIWHLEFPSCPAMGLNRQKPWHVWRSAQHWPFSSCGRTTQAAEAHGDEEAGSGRNVYVQAFLGWHPCCCTFDARFDALHINQFWLGSQVLLHHAKCMQHCRRNQGKVGCEKQWASIVGTVLPRGHGYLQGFTTPFDKSCFLVVVTSLGVEGTWDCEKAPCTDLRSDPTLQQNSYRTTQADAYVNHAHQTSAARVVTNLIKLKHCRVKKTVSPSTPTYWRQAPSFRSRRNTISHRETKHNKQTTKTKHKKETGREGVPSVGLSYVKLCDTAALVH